MKSETLAKKLFAKSEGSLQKSVVPLLKKGPGWWVKVSDRFVSNIPDILGCFFGRFCAIELKRPGKKGPTPGQRHNMDLIIEAGGIAVWVTTLKEAKEYLKKWKKDFGGKSD